MERIPEVYSVESCVVNTVHRNGVQYGKVNEKICAYQTGAKDFIICTIVTTIQNIMLMAPVAILYYITSDLISGSISKSNNVAYIIACVIMLVVMGIVFYFQYNTSFFSTYIESEHRRINLAEKLRELPLSFLKRRIYRI